MKTFANIEATETGEATSAHLRANGWDGVIYMGEVRTARTVKSAMFYRNAKTGEYVVVASVAA